jgi:hypothetical protein
VEINEAGESGDLMRKHRVDAVPALVVSAKDSADMRVYGIPTGYALSALLDALIAAGTPFDPKSHLPEKIRSVCGVKPRPSIRLDLVSSRRDPVCAEAASVLWRIVQADNSAGGPLRLLASLRIVDDFPFWAAALPEGLPIGGGPFLLIDGSEAMVWPFAAEDILLRLSSRL